MRYLSDIFKQSSWPYMTSTNPSMNDVFDAMFGGSAASNIREVRKSFDEHFKNTKKSSASNDPYLGRRFDYMKNLQEKVIRKEFELRDKGVNIESKVPVIQTSLSFDNFFHPRVFVPINKSLIIGQRDFIQLRLYPDNKWKVFIKDNLLFFDIYVRDNKWDNVINDADLCKQIIHMFRLAKSKGEFKFEVLCDKCQNTKKLLQDTVEHSVWNGIPINIHQQQEISCTCNS